MLPGLYAQPKTRLSVTFVPMMNDVPLDLSEEAASEMGEEPLIEALRFYVSQVELWDNDKKVFIESNSFHLIDAEQHGGLQFDLPVDADLVFTHLRFKIGVDSLTQLSGAFGGDLDPTKGMYWTWQSGYIHFKLEGKATQCPARHHRFQYHIGGFQSPNNTIQEIVLEVSDQKAIKVELALDKIFDQVDVADTDQIMNPNKTAVEFSNLFPSLFTIVQ